MAVPGRGVEKGQLAKTSGSWVIFLRCGLMMAVFRADGTFFHSGLSGDRGAYGRGFP